MSSSSSINSLLSSTTNTNTAISLSSILASATGATTPGIDVAGAVAAGIYADRAPERIWQADQVTLTSQTTALTAMQTATNAIATDMQSLNTLNGPLAARTVTSSNTNDITATAATGTVAGVHTVAVNSLATTASWYSDLETGSNAPTVTLPASSMTITLASGKSATIATGIGTPADNLNNLAIAINTAKTADGTSLGVTATVVSDSTGSRLAIISNSPGSAAGFSITTPDFSGTSWTSPTLPTGSTLGANSVKLTTSTGTATIQTTTGETYAQLASTITNATIATSFGSAQTGLASTDLLTAGSVTTIQDSATGSTFTYKAAAGNTIGDLNNAIAAAVTAGTLSTNVAGTISGGNEVISQGLTDQGITVSTNDAVLGPMSAGVTRSLGLTANAANDSNGSSLTIVATDGSSFTINEPAFGFTQASLAANASLTVDGVPIQSASNTVTGAIPGVTLSLLGSSLGAPISLTVASDASQVSTAIHQFVTDYNTALGLVNNQFAVSASSSYGILGSDPTVRALQSALLQALNYVNTPPAGGSTTVATLGALGISAGSGGTLTINSATLTNALINNPTDVQNFFEGAALNGFASNLYGALDAFTSPANGAFQVDLRSISATNDSLTTNIKNFETSYIANQQTILTAEFSAAEIALQQLPTQMAQLNAMLGMNTKSGG